MALENEDFMLFTTFRRDGRAVGTPVWLVHLPSGELAFTTGAESGKVKRLRHTPRVTLQACDRRGQKTHGPVLEAVARSVVDDDQVERVRAAVTQKYGAMAKAIGVVATVAGRLGSRRAAQARVAVIVTVSDSAEDPRG